MVGLPRKLKFAALLAVICAVVILGCTEALLRWRGIRPWEPGRVHPNEPTIHQPDPVLGWRNLPGTYVYPGYSPDAPEIRMTFLDDGSRACGAPAAGGRPTLVFVGGSFTQGFAVDDDETFPWKVQARFPALSVRNFGTGGYGTYQSLLLLERLFERSPPNLVVYGFIAEHEVRNVAPAAWLSLLARFSTRGHVAVPYCTLDAAGSLVRHAPESYPEWPLRDELAVVNFFQQLHMINRTADRAARKTEVTDRLLLEMNDLCAAHGASFAVALLHGFAPARQQECAAFLIGHGIRVIDCNFPLDEETQVAGEGHPNGLMHTRWAERICPAIREMLAEREDS